MKPIAFLRVLDSADLATTARDLTPLLKSFREHEPAALRVIESHWPEIAADLARHGDDDVVVLVGDTPAVVPRASAVELTRTTDPHLADVLDRDPARLPSIDVVVELGGRLALLQVEHRVEAPRPPQIDWARSFTLWDREREKHAHCVYLDSGEAVVTWFNLASLLDLTEDELSERAGAIARALTIKARHGDANVLCVRTDLVEAFLAEIERAR